MLQQQSKLLSKQQQQLQQIQLHHGSDAYPEQKLIDQMAENAQLLNSLNGSEQRLDKIQNTLKRNFMQNRKASPSKQSIYCKSNSIKLESKKSMDYDWPITIEVKWYQKFEKSCDLQAGNKNFLKILDIDEQPN